MNHVRMKEDIAGVEFLDGLDDCRPSHCIGCKYAETRREGREIQAWCACTGNYPNDEICDVYKISKKQMEKFTSEFIAAVELVKKNPDSQILQKKIISKLLNTIEVYSE